MEFDRTEFLSKYLRIGYNGPEVLADELHALHAEIDVLKARLPEPKPERETGWAVVDLAGDPLADDGMFLFKKTILGSDHRVVWFDKATAEAFCNAVAECCGGRKVPPRPAMLYKDTLEEVK